MLFAMQTLDINRQQNYMVQLTLKILSSSQSAGCVLTIFFTPQPSSSSSKAEHQIVLCCDSSRAAALVVGLHGGS